jgi:glycosyltransferase involved in cell wall biosynthesis
MASGLPIVTTPSSGSVARDGLDGFVVPPRDVDALVERLRYLHEHPGERRAMGGRARDLMAAHYTWHHYRERVAGAYREILGARA